MRTQIIQPCRLIWIFLKKPGIEQQFTLPYINKLFGTTINEVYAVGLLMLVI